MSRSPEHSATIVRTPMRSGLFKSQERAKQKTNGQQRLSIKDAHLLGNISNAHEIEDRQQKAVEDGQNTGSVSFADLTVVLAQGHIAPPMQSVFNRPVLPHQMQEPLGRGLV